MDSVVTWFILTGAFFYVLWLFFARVIQELEDKHRYSEEEWQRWEMTK